MKYILDFDRTLFDSLGFMQKLQEDEMLSAKSKTPEIWNKYYACDFLFQDTVEWLSSKSKEDLFILTAITPTFGPKAEGYQRRKLERSGLDNYVSEIVFVIGDKGEKAIEIASQFPSNETIVFVDDRLCQCQSVKAALPNSICCLMVRDKSCVIETDFDEDIKVVHSLSDVDGIISNI
jgi:FMN phosphatase YigB (HAD superfamily)